jgi:hypothetical protein
MTAINIIKTDNSLLGYSQKDAGLRYKFKIIGPIEYK